MYEQRLILKYIAENAKDPVTGEELTEEDLVEIKPSECQTAADANGMNIAHQSNIN